MKIGDRPVGEGAPAFILAEVASAHQGEASLARKLARSARQAGADGVKFQMFRAEELIAPNDPRFPTFRQIELSDGEWDSVLAETEASGLAMLVEVFDRQSLVLAERHAVAAYKIHSTDVENAEFIRHVSATGRPLLIATGGLGLGAVEKALAAASREGNLDIMLLHGVQNFPTRIEDSHLAYIGTLKRTFGLPVGFLDHVDGGSPMATVLPMLSVAFGADLVEKHITVDRSARGFDFESALEEDTFKAMVELIREAEKAVGRKTLPAGASSESYHRLMRRAVVSRKPLSRGEPLTRDGLAFVRNETGLAPSDSPRLIGRKPKRDIPAWEPLTDDLFE